MKKELEERLEPSIIDFAWSDIFVSEKGLVDVYPKQYESSSKNDRDLEDIRVLLNSNRYTERHEWNVVLSPLNSVMGGLKKKRKDILRDE